MCEKGWRDVLETIWRLAEHQQVRLTWGQRTLLVERRGQIWVALREMTAAQCESICSSQPCTSIAEAKDGQILYIAGTHYLCSWRREPTHWDWLQTLAARKF